MLEENNFKSKQEGEINKIVQYLFKTGNVDYN